jgi:hypothetical protein
LDAPKLDDSIERELEKYKEAKRQKEEELKKKEIEVGKVVEAQRKYDASSSKLKAKKEKKQGETQSGKQLPIVEMIEVEVWPLACADCEFVFTETKNKFCPNCGTSVEPKMETRPKTNPIGSCPHCGSHFDEPTVFCSDCGLRVVAEAKPEAVQNSDEIATKKKRKSSSSSSSSSDDDTESMQREEARRLEESKIEENRKKMAEEMDAFKRQQIDIEQNINLSEKQAKNRVEELSKEPRKQQEAQLEITPPPADFIQYRVVAAFEYAAQESNELNLDKGDKVVVLNDQTGIEGWWYGKSIRGVGLLPANFVEKPEIDAAVVALLEKAGLAQYAALFDIAEVEADAIKDLSEADLTELGLPQTARAKLFSFLRLPVKGAPKQNLYKCECGNQWDNDAEQLKFCAECGETVGPKTKSPPLYKCKTCGVEWDNAKDELKFCADCGSPVQDALEQARSVIKISVIEPENDPELTVSFSVQQILPSSKF